MFCSGRLDVFPYFESKRMSKRYTTIIYNIAMVLKFIISGCTSVYTLDIIDTRLSAHNK